jgi:hypothetical protein
VGPASVSRRAEALNEYHQQRIQTMLASAMWSWHAVDQDTIALAPDDVP